MTATELDPAVLAVVDDAVVTEMERSRQPGLTLGITDRDRALAVRTYGFAELASCRPVTPETPFEIGSIGKTFTAIAVLQLRDEGASTSTRRAGRPAVSDRGTVRHMRRCMVVACAIVLLGAAPALPVAAAGNDTPAHMRAIVREWSKRLNAGDNRGIAKLFSLLPLGLGFLLAGITVSKQALHDIFADTRVIWESETE